LYSALPEKYIFTSVSLDSVVLVRKEQT